MRYFVKKPLCSLFALTAFANTAYGISPQSRAIEEVLVTSDFRKSAEMTYAASISIVGSDQIQGRAAQHLEEILNVAPNVNFAGGASRNRYLQIRGIGERSQFVDPINPSVGLMIDGIDLSGVGNASTLFDIEQVEVLRGPQGTNFGASALAGMVSIRSKAPTDSFEGLVNAGLGNYDGWQTGVVLSGPLTEDLLGRVAVEQFRSDGFIDNVYLGRDDTGDRDEMTARGKLQWQASERLTLNGTLFYINVDNGYDAFSLDNNRNTLSDQPGRDAQETLALALSADWVASPLFAVVATLGLENTNVEYGYDEDWTNTAICDDLACDSSLWGFDWWYSTTDTYNRDRKSKQLDIRLISAEQGKLFGAIDWVTGLYGIDQQEDLVRDYSGAASLFDNSYDTQRLAWYGELSIPLAEKITFTLGGRIEDFSADYDDSRGVSAEPEETLWGGEMTLEYHTNENTLVYGLVSRGFKAGGVNGEALGRAEERNFEQSVIDFLASRLTFDTETATNFELGFKGSYWQDRWQLRLAAFYMERDDVQLKGWYNEGQLFVGYTDNGASGTNKGIELETAVTPVDDIRFFASLGFLDTEIKDFYVLSDTDALVNKSGRDQAHAPAYQFNIGTELDLTDRLQIRIETDGRDEFYFSDSHDKKSKSYALLHASLNYRMADLTLKLWGRNLADKDYAVRGFYFPNDPRAFYEDDQAYVQLGDPRTYGVSASYEF
ncbi:MAG: TonB-dependent receptor [Porticoccaceae bacterium]|nr:TonB-dependent receptor [Porticoccaceae bacterium]